LGYAAAAVHLRQGAGIALWLCVSLERVRTEMTNEQLYLVVGAPLFFNAVLIGLLMAYINAKFGAIDKRFDDMRDLWRSESPPRRRGYRRPSEAS
jgi:hypothetical protein